MKESLNEKLKNRTANIAVVGLGYVGLPIALAFSERGFRTFGIDVDSHKLSKLNAGESYVGDIDDRRISDAFDKTDGSALEVFGDFRCILQCDAVIVCVPTPLSKTSEPDMGHVISAFESFSPYLHAGMVISLESTTYPGATEEVLLPLIENHMPSGLVIGEDFHLIFSPERIDPGRDDWTLTNTPKIVGGVTPQCLEIGKDLYGSIVDRIIPVSSTTAAETVKLLENTFRMVNIALANEMALICDRLSIDVWEVIQSAATKPFGFMPFYPGPGIGGHCIPVDPQYLAWKLKMLDYDAKLINASEIINSIMPNFVVQKTKKILYEKGVKIKDARILVLGVAYKADVGDVRESPAIEIIQEFLLVAKDVQYNDPFVDTLELDGMTLLSTALDKDFLSTRDVVVIVTDHSAYDYREIMESSKLILDTRNAIKPIRDTQCMVVRL